MLKDYGEMNAYNSNWKVQHQKTPTSVNIKDRMENLRWVYNIIEGKDVIGDTSERIIKWNKFSKMGQQNDELGAD